MRCGSEINQFKVIAVNTEGRLLYIWLCKLHTFLISFNSVIVTFDIGAKKEEGDGSPLISYVIVVYGSGTTFAKPINAIANKPAVTKAIGTPRIASGVSSISSRSRIPAKSTKARAKPTAVATE